MRDAARADEGKVVVSGEDSEEDEEEKELEDMVKAKGGLVVREEGGCLFLKEGSDKLPLNEAAASELISFGR